MSHLLRATYIDRHYGFFLLYLPFYRGFFWTHQLAWCRFHILWKPKMCIQVLRNKYFKTQTTIKAEVIGHTSAVDTFKDTKKLFLPLVCKYLTLP